MAQQTKQWAAIIMMIALFAMIAFVTNLCSPMAVIVQNQFGASELQSQIGNYANFIAYLVMGIPSGMLIVKFGYKKTALIALGVGIVGMLLELLSGSMGSYWIYLLGAFVSGFCMCMLNTVVNPMLNVLGGGGNTGNQLIQIGGAFNSAAAVAVYIILGALIGEVTKETGIADAAPAMYIALAIFVLAAVVLFFTKIEEPKQEPVKMELVKGALSYRHFALGALAIFLYMSVEVGTPTYMIKYLIGEVGISAGVASLIAAVYWFAMFIGRSIGGSIGSKVSSRTMVSTVAIAAIALLAFGILSPASWKVNVPGVDWANLSMIWVEVPIGVAAFICVGLCTSVMWGGIFNMAVEGLGKYTAAASGIFMTMVFGCAVMVAVQAFVIDITGSILGSYIIPLVCAGYILFYALVGSKPAQK
ncbi:MAG: MFS transporter [Parabacteroides sp.]|nr:MFS transporter [Parabacteroides sp.]MDD6080549.1 MFS transporter [bacterium]MCI7009965.1 MFS transporter [Parabacteroides sp.]MCI7782402.1 MFS transporter [Parabacteroides sp.]MDD7061661.1 MFS transporter [bacterium]